jgi:hypothetical protein
MVKEKQSSPIFTRLSFSQLTDDVKADVLRCARRAPTDNPADEWPISPLAVFSNRLRLPDAVKRSKLFIQRKINPVGFAYLTDTQADFYEKELSFAFYLALADCEKGILETRADLASRRDHLFHVGGLLAQLRHRKEPVSPLVGDKDYPDHYFGLLVMAPKIKEALEAMLFYNSADQARQYVEYPGSFNEWRFYLIWMSQLITSICLTLQHFRYHTSFALANLLLGDVAVGTGFMGCALYFLRGGVSLAFVCEISSQMQSLRLSWADRWGYFAGKWDERKFIILNDLIWGFVNLFCFVSLFFWPALMVYGNMANSGLFILDFSLSLWQLQEERTKHEAVMHQHERSMRSIHRRIARREEKISLLLKDTVLAVDVRAAYLNRYSTEIKQLEWTLEDLQRSQKTRVLDWYYDQKKIEAGAWYTFGLVVGFAVLCCFFTPMAPLSVLMITLLGSVMCFGFTMLYKMRGAHIETLRTESASEQIELDYEASLKLFKAAGDNDALKRQMFLDVRSTWAQTTDQKALVEYQRADMWCTFTIDMLLPTVFLAAFVLLPIPSSMAIAVVAVCLLMMFAAKCYVAEFAPESVRGTSSTARNLNRVSGFFKSVTGQNTTQNQAAEAEAQALLPPPFPEQEYQKFCSGVSKGYTSERLKAHVSPTFSDGHDESTTASGDPSFT